MALDAEHYEPRILQILSAPGTDLSTISARGVRRELLKADPSLSAKYVKQHRDEFDALIGAVYERVSGESEAHGQADEHTATSDADEQPAHASRKRQHGDGGRAESPPAKKAKKASRDPKKVSDEELARKLSDEINGRERKTRTNGKTKVVKARARKSAEIVNSDGESDGPAPKKKAKKRASTGGGAKGGFAKEFILSEPLAVVVQAERMSRPQVVKQLWAYIKDRDLQEPTNKRNIVCDDNLRAVFSKDKIDMFAMNKVLGQHLHEPES